ncbi:GNAT family N-acetyltransferase [Microbacterium sp. 4R-513]|uniref:GNAT family N-acetyltransferase n=1 Tax=Microbacterium sp. 4R-513 TaxID=2567934 RepID=UPI0013E1F766|nr:GNAT family N-acetyltransferase [Microbacterium sp. 4R-513]QIG39499.1 GNAT family N-acetyltransferase [Microbacterium sp. 4R-513]
MTAPVELSAELAPLTGRAEFDAASALYRRVFGYDDRFSLNSKLMLAIGYAGGVNMGAWSAEGELVGFVYGFPAVEDGRCYLFSQAACVDAGWRGRGVGTALKHAQLHEARRNGLDRMRWAFDPANLRNARINLDKLGARARWFRRDFYDDGESDRLIVEWDGVAHEARLAPAVDPSVELFGTVQVLGERTAAITAPGDGPMSPATRAALSGSLRQLLDDGLAVTRCAPIAPGVFAYVCQEDSR